MPITRILLAPGASGTVERLAPHAGGLERRGLDVTLVELPRGSAERAVPKYRASLDVVTAEHVAIGGHSFGARVASLVAIDTRPAGLVLLSYPLHAPGRHVAWEARTAHWSALRCPALVLSGEADPFARLDLLQLAVAGLADATLVTYPGVRHGLESVLDDALDRVAQFVAALA